MDNTQNQRTDTLKKRNKRKKKKRRMLFIKKKHTYATKQHVELDVNRTCLIRKNPSMQINYSLTDTTTTFFILSFAFLPILTF